MLKPLYFYLVFICFNPDIVSSFPMLLHAWTDLKYTFLDLVCRKGIPFTKKKSMASSILWWFLSMIGVNGILGMVLWFSGILLVALPCMMSIWGPYMDSDLLILYVVIVQFLILLVWVAYFRVCVYIHITSCWIILASYATFIYRLWKHDLFLSTLLEKVYCVVWY